MLKIGVTPCFMYPDKTRTVFGPKSLAYLEVDMGRHLATAEVMPILIPDLDDDRLQIFMDQLEGLVLQGGTDLAPETYGAKPIENGRWKGDPYRDAYELKLIRLALERQLPIYGICRGFQLLNCYFGGTLLQDIGIQHTTDVLHRDADKYDQIFHEIKIPQESLFADWSKNETVLVNSIHHQCVDKLAAGLTIGAYSAEDEIVEAFYKAGPGEQIIAVQWHPEFFYNLDLPLFTSTAPYNHFLNNCNK